LSVSDDFDVAKPPVWDERLGLDFLSDSDKVDSTEVVYTAWHRIVSYSSGLKFTFKKDRLVALSALASIVASKLDGDRYLAGLWMKNIHRDLLWHRAGLPLKPLVAIPTWSWASGIGDISFDLLDGSSTFQSITLGEIEALEGKMPDIDSNFRMPLSGKSASRSFVPLGELLSTKVASASSIGLGEFFYVSLELSAPCTTYPRIRIFPPEFLLGSGLLTDALDVDRKWSQVLLAFVGRSVHSNHKDQTWHAIMVESNGKGQWQRIGVAALHLKFADPDCAALWTAVTVTRRLELV
jgi:hypothetical protein